MRCPNSNQRTFSGGPMARKTIPKKQISEKQKAYFEILVARLKSPEARQQRSEQSKKMWADPEFRLLQSESRKRSWTPERRQAKGKWTAEFNRTEKAKASRSITSAANWENKEIRSRMLGGMVRRKAEIFRSRPVTDFEARCYQFLDECGIRYERQHAIVEAFTIPDAYIEDARICIYFDSEYWHSKPQNAARDLRQRRNLELLGYKVLVIRCDQHAREINKIDLEIARQILCRN